MAGPRFLTRNRGIRPPIVSRLRVVALPRDRAGLRSVSQALPSGSYPTGTLSCRSAGLAAPPIARLPAGARVPPRARVALPSLPPVDAPAQYWPAPACPVPRPTTSLQPTSASGESTPAQPRWPSDTGHARGVASRRSVSRPTPRQAQLLSSVAAATRHRGRRPRRPPRPASVGGAVSARCRVSTAAPPHDDIPCGCRKKGGRGAGVVRPLAVGCAPALAAPSRAPGAGDVDRLHGEDWQEAMRSSGARPGDWPPVTPPIADPVGSLTASPRPT